MLRGHTLIFCKTLKSRMGWWGGGGKTNVTVRYIDFERYITVDYDFNLMFSFTYISIQTVNITFKSAG